MNDTNLKTMDLASIRSFYDEPAAAKHAGAGLAADRKLVRCHRRKLLDQRHIANAVNALEKLPDEGESFHLVIRGNFPLWSIVPATLRLAAPATIRNLFIATLGFSRSIGEELLGLLDAGKIGNVTLISSCYFKTLDTTLFTWLASELTQRGQKIVGVRSHAKVFAMDMGQAGAFVVETSGNARSCRNVEQMCLIQDRELFNFHAAWMNEIATKGDQK